MYAPTACTTPTRLPTLWWSLAAALLLLGAIAPAIAAEGCFPPDPMTAPATDGGR